MTDYQTAYETLAAAVWGAIAHLRNPGVLLKRWEIATALEDTLERALDQASTPGVGEPCTCHWGPDDAHSCKAPHPKAPAAAERIQFHKDGAYVKVELTKSDNAAVENIQDDAAEPTWRETCTAPIQWDLMSPEAKGATPDPDAAEREHCERVANELRQNRMMRVEPTDVAVLLRERADAASVARLAAQTEIERLHDEVTELLAERDQAWNRAVEAERARVRRIVEAAENDDRSGPVNWSSVYERVGSGR